MEKIYDSNKFEGTGAVQNVQYVHDDKRQYLFFQIMQLLKGRFDSKNLLGALLFGKKAEKYSSLLKDGDRWELKGAVRNRIKNGRSSITIHVNELKPIGKSEDDLELEEAPTVPF